MGTILTSGLYETLISLAPNRNTVLLLEYWPLSYFELNQNSKRQKCVLPWRNAAPPAWCLDKNTSLAVLDTIPDCFPDNWTINFGGLVAAIDAYACRQLDLRITHHVK